MRLGIGELTIILLIILILFGAKKLPEIARAIGQSLNEFRKAGKEVSSGTEQEKTREEDKG